MNSTPPSTVSAPIATQRAFSRPAALIGGAIGLVALTAVATTLALRPPASSDADARGAPATAALALSTPMTPGRATAAPEAPADFPATMTPPATPPATPHATPVARKAAAPAPSHVQRGTVKAADAGARTASACPACGKVEAVTAVQKKGEGSGLGVVGGAVVGGLVGSQIGGGSGKNAMAVLGAVGGGVAGNEIEKRARATTVYQVRVRMDDGTLRTITQNTAPAVGQPVTVEGSTLRARSSTS
jgi:outer membrane lipoprotein SlyB